MREVSPCSPPLRHDDWTALCARQRDQCWPQWWIWSECVRVQIRDMFVSHTVTLNHGVEQAANSPPRVSRVALGLHFWAKRFIPDLAPCTSPVRLCIGLSLFRFSKSVDGCGIDLFTWGASQSLGPIAARVTDELSPGLNTRTYNECISSCWP